MHHVSLFPLTESQNALGLFLCGLLFTSSFSSTARADLVLYADVNTNLGGNPARQQGTSGTVTNAADRSLNNLLQLLVLLRLSVN